MQDLIIRSVLIILVAFYVCPEIVRSVLGSLNDKIKDTQTNMRNEASILLQGSPLYDELEQQKFIDRQKEDLNYITGALGIIELVIFSSTTILYLALRVNDPLTGFLELATILGGWIGVKALGNYTQWGRPIFGRAYFYVFFIGSLLNISFSIFIGVAFYFLVIKLQLP